MIFTFRAIGLPAPEGSHAAFRDPRSGRQVVKHDSKGLKGWRARCRIAALSAYAAKLEAGGARHPGVYPAPIAGPVALSAVFILPRPKKTAHPLCDVPPDLDKLLRALKDSLSCPPVKAAARKAGFKPTGGVLVDDRQVVELGRVRKRWSVGEELAGVEVTIATREPAAGDPSKPLLARWLERRGLAPFELLRAWELAATSGRLPYDQAPTKQALALWVTGQRIPTLPFALALEALTAEMGDELEAEAWIRAAGVAGEEAGA